MLALESETKVWPAKKKLEHLSRSIWGIIDEIEEISSLMKEKNTQESEYENSILRCRQPGWLHCRCAELYGLAILIR